MDEKEAKKRIMKDKIFGAIATIILVSIIIVRAQFTKPYELAWFVGVIMALGVAAAIGALAHDIYIIRRNK